MQTCRTKKTNKCFYLTKENREEFLNKFLPKMEIKYYGINNNFTNLEDFENYFTISNCNYYYDKRIFYYNNWYVIGGIGYFDMFNEEEFNENYELVEKENKLWQIE